MKKLVLALSVLGLSAVPVLAAQSSATKSEAKIEQVAEAMTSGHGKMTETTSGKILTTAEGHTLYTFDKDKNGASSCDAACLKIWPAYHASAKVKAAAPWTKVKATDGKDMWAYNGKPVYTYIKDKKTGDTEGDGVGGNWHIIK